MQTLYISYYQSPIGLLKIGGTDSCITLLSFVDKDEELSASTGSTDILQYCTEQLIEYFNGSRRSFDIPVYQEGTGFQQKVWSELLAIPFGKTISYLDLAKRMGDPKVIRAAASTNGKNKIAIIIPCHRVIGSNRSLVGYAGGLWRKKWLLDHENKIAHGLQTLF